MKKVVLNNCYGGFSLSEKACKFLGLKLSDYLASRLYSRDDPKLVECIEVLGEEANGLCADLVIVEYDDRNYTYLKTVDHVPCSRDMYYDRYRRFFWLLNEARG